MSRQGEACALEGLLLLANQHHVARRHARQCTKSACLGHESRSEVRSDQSGAVGSHAEHAGLDKAEKNAAVRIELNCFGSERTELRKRGRGKRRTGGGRGSDANEHNLRRRKNGIEREFRQVLKMRWREKLNRLILN